MDLSSEYISMCNKAKEIQEAWKPAWGDYISDTTDPSYAVPLISHTKQINDKPKKERGLIFCPRQDQLQELVLDIYVEKYAINKAIAVALDEMLSDFYNFLQTISCCRLRSR